VASWNWCIFSVIIYFFRLSFAYFMHYQSVSQEKIMTAEEFAQFPIATLTNTFTTNGFKHPATRGRSIYGHCG
jgi:hypothetical protein